MLEVVALSALTAFLAAAGNGAGGEIGKQLLLSTGALVNRTLGRETPLPAGTDSLETLASQVHARIGDDPRRAAEWASLLRSVPDQDRLSLAPGTLPPAPRNFTDRERTVRRLKREATRPAAGRSRCAQLSGPPGIGTTAVALHVGALLHTRFPDGQFYVDLRDAAGENGPEPAAVLQRLLREMGVEHDRIPPTAAARERLYRQLTAGRRVLVVIDHASSVAQVRGLIPSTPDVFLLVVVSGRPFTLDALPVVVPPMSDRHALKMLRKVAGREPIARVKQQLPALLNRCAGNAFALRTAALRPVTDGAAPFDPTADPSGDHPVREATRAACAGLRPETVRLCRLTALGGWPSIDARLAAAAAGIEPAEAAQMLAEAVDVQLLEPLPDGRHRFRPEIRRYLADTAGPEHGIAACSAAVTCVLDALLNRVVHAAHAALPQSWRTEPAPESGTPCRDEAEGVAVLAAEVRNVVRAVSVAEEYQHIDTALRLARGLWPLQLKAGYWDEVLPALRLAARCADEHRPDSRTAGALHFQLAHCLGELGREEEADRAADAAVACERAAGHIRGEASSVELQGLLSMRRWSYAAAHQRFVEAESIYRGITSGQDEAVDLPRAFALVRRHQGRALRGMGRLAEARVLLEAATAFFAEEGEAYNQARALTDLAEALHEAGENAEALAKITVAERLLTPAATPHLMYLAGLRLRCEAVA